MHMPLPTAAALNAALPRNYTIYMIERLVDCRRYVGLTARTIEARIRAHIYDAKREGRARSADSLGTAIRKSIQAGRSFDQDFRGAVLQTGLTAEEARQAEARWINRLESSAPAGFNKLPAGSLGGPGNAQPVTLLHPIRGDVTHASLYSAINVRNAELRATGEKTLLPSTVYERISLGWTPEEALGYLPHQDGRGERDPVRYRTKRYASLAAVAKVTGEQISTLRSRLHRAQRAGISDPDLSIDRRSMAAPRTIILLPDPNCPTNGIKLHVNEFAARTGVPRSTIVFRVGRMLEDGLDVEQMDQAEFVKRLITEEDRRIPIQLRLDDRILDGGIREVVRQVLGNAELETSRDERLGESAIRARLRRADMSDATQVRWAFGFAP